jgi:predicted nucleic acid-binding protein
VPEAVAEEVGVHSDEAARVLNSEAHWIMRVSPGQVQEAISAWDLGQGESAVLTWALSHPGTIAVIDDFAARKYAQVLRIPVIGTLGLILLAKTRAWIPAARPVVEEVRRAGLYLSDDLVARILSVVDE